MDVSTKRVTTPEDIAVLAALASEIWHEHFPGIISAEQVDYMVERFQSVPAITEQLSNGYIYDMIVADGENAGFIGYHPEEHSLFLSKLYVKKEFRGRRLGRFGIEYLEDYCRKNNLHSIWLTCNKHNDGSAAVYDRLGFNIIRSEVTDIGNGYVMDDYIFEKKL